MGETLDLHPFFPLWSPLLSHFFVNGSFSLIFFSLGSTGLWLEWFWTFAVSLSLSLTLNWTALSLVVRGKAVQPEVQGYVGETFGNPVEITTTTYRCIVGRSNKSCMSGFLFMMSCGRRKSWVFTHLHIHTDTRPLLNKRCFLSFCLVFFYVVQELSC